MGVKNLLGFSPLIITPRRLTGLFDLGIIEGRVLLGRILKRRFQDMLLDAIQYNSENFDLIQKICAPLQDYIGVNLVQYRRFYLNGGLITLFNHSEWMKTSFEKQYWYSSVFQNKISALLEKKSLYYLWPEKPLAHDSLYCGLYDQDIWNGITIYKKYADCVESYSFASSRENMAVRELYFSEIELLEHFISYFRTKIFTLITGVEKKIIIPCELNVPKNIEQDHLRKKFIEETKTNCFYLRHKGVDLKLTKRESECLALLSYGKQVKEVAKLLKLSSRTVEAYLDGIKAKIGCNTKSQAVFLYKQQSNETADINKILKEET